MVTSQLVKALREGQLRIQSASLPTDEQRVLCEKIAELMGRETVACNDHDQQRWLVAKAWASAAGKTRQNARQSGPRRKTSPEQIQVIFADLPAEE